MAVLVIRSVGLLETYKKGAKGHYILFKWKGLWSKIIYRSVGDLENNIAITMINKGD